MIQNSNFHVDAPKESREFKSPSNRSNFSNWKRYLLFSPCHTVSPKGLSRCLFWFLSLFGRSPCSSSIPLSLLWLPRLILKKSSFNQVSTVFFSSSPWITFSYCLLLCHPGNDKGRYFPFYIHAGEPCVLNFFFPAHDIFLMCPLQDVSGWPYHSVGRTCV